MDLVFKVLFFIIFILVYKYRIICESRVYHAESNVLEVNQTISSRRINLSLYYLRIIFFIQMLLYAFDQYLYLGPRIDSILFKTIGMLIFLIGSFLLCWTHYRMIKAFHGDLVIQKMQELITTGPFRLIRHPMYTSSFLISLGFAMLSGISTFLIHACILLILFVKRISLEEGMMQNHFEEYDVYMSKTYKMFPYIY